MKCRYIVALIAAAYAVLSSCTDNMDMQTTINADGTCSRELKFKKENADWNKGEGSRRHVSDGLADPAWSKREVVSDKPEQEGEKPDTSYVVSRSFESVDEMASAYPLVIDGKVILKSCELRKRFRWFYTDYTFTEVYNDFSHIFPVLIDYMDNDEVSFMLTGQPNIYEGMNGYEIMSSTNENLHEMLFCANSAYVVIEALAHYADSVPDAPITGKRLLDGRSDFIENGLWQLEELKWENKEELLKVMSKYYGVELMEWAKKALQDKGVSDYMNQQEARCFDVVTLCVDYKLEMPGEVIDTGNGVMDGGRIRYRLTGVRLLSHDYTITATSRVTNTWAHVVTILLVLVAIVSGIMVWRKRR